MSNYNTVDAVGADSGPVTVKVYCEVPMDSALGVLLNAGAPDVYLDPDQAVRLATALLNAAQRVRHACDVDAVVAGKRR